jgi:hypothetical protein
MKLDCNDTIRVIGPSVLKQEKIPARRVPVGFANDYKPCIARLPDGALLLTDFHWHAEQHGVTSGLSGNWEPTVEHMVLHRSTDMGKTWDIGRHLTFPGREPYFTVLKDGKIFMTTSVLFLDVMNPKGYGYAVLHSSNDSGATWDSQEFSMESSGWESYNSFSRKILERPDGVLMLGYFPGVRGREMMLYSKDRGQSWEAKRMVFKGYDPQAYYLSPIDEAVMFYSPSGRIMMITRVDLSHLKFTVDVPYIEYNTEVAGGFDHYHRAILFESKDEGLSWDPVRGLGFMGIMYPSIVPLGKSKLLYTFTVRAPVNTHMGVQAVVIEELEDGSFDVDMDKDRLLIDEKTPDYLVSGGGFGPTIRLDDETLMTSYSYRPDTRQYEIKNKVFDATNFNKYVERYPSQVEVAIWNIPDEWR